MKNFLEYIFRFLFTASLNLEEVLVTMFTLRFYEKTSDILFVSIYLKKNSINDTSLTISL